MLIVIGPVTGERFGIGLSRFSSFDPGGICRGLSVLPCYKIYTGRLFVGC